MKPHSFIHSFPKIFQTANQLLVLPPKDESYGDETKTYNLPSNIEIIDKMCSSNEQNFLQF